MKSVLCVAAACILVAAGPKGDSRTADFRVGGVSFSLPMPDGYCPPVDKQADVAQVVAAADTQNVTDLTLVRCGAAVVNGANDVTIIKTPRAALLATIDRASLLAQIGKEFDAPADVLAATTNGAIDEAAKSASENLGTKLSLGGSMAPRGKDEVCGYLAGVLHVETPLSSYDQPMAACLTAVGGRVIFVYRSGLRKDDAGILQLMREARAMAVSIKVMSGT